MTDIKEPPISEAVDPAALAGEGLPPAIRRRRQGRRTPRRVVAQFLPPILMGGVLIGFWYFVSYVLLRGDDNSFDPPHKGNRFLLQPPHQVLKVGFLDGEHFSEIMGGLWSSTRIALIGLLISIVLGFTLATIMSQTKILERAFYPYLVMLQAIPILAIVPLIQFWWGSGEPIWDYPVISAINSRVIVCVIISLFPIIVNTLFGLQSAERDMHDLFTLHHANRLTRLRKLMFPAASPAIFAGLRISAGLSVIGAIVGDFFFGRGDIGIGQLLRKYSNNLQGEELLAAVIMSSALGVAVFLVFGWLQTLVIGKWHDPSSS